MNELQKVPEFGIEGYRMPNPSKIHFEKPLTFRMIKAKKEDNFITQAVRDKKGVPSPTLYQPQQDQTSMILKNGMSIYMTNRQTFYQELSRKSKNAGPSVGTYTLKDGMNPDNMRGCFKR